MQIQEEALEQPSNKNAICYEESREDPTDICQAQDNKVSSEKVELHQSDDISQNPYNEDNGFNDQMSIDLPNYFVSVEQQNIQEQDDPHYSFSEQDDHQVNQFNSQSFNILQESSQPLAPEYQVVQTKVSTKIPGETKNLPKCFARRIKEFILNSVEHSDDPELKNILDNSDVKSFLKQKPEKISKQKLDIFIRSEIGSMFCQEFFGNCRWSYGLTKEGKTNVETCFRYNIQYYLNSLKKIKLN